jgi:hypothetical protein
MNPYLESMDKEDPKSGGVEMTENPMMVHDGNLGKKKDRSF